MSTSVFQILLIQNGPLLEMNSDVKLFDNRLCVFLVLGTLCTLSKEVLLINHHTRKCKSLELFLVFMGLLIKCMSMVM